jgi:hypothetical protein
MEMGSKNKDTKLLQQLQEGAIKRENEKVQEYLVRRLQNIPKAL